MLIQTYGFIFTEKLKSLSIFNICANMPDISGPFLSSDIKHWRCNKHLYSAYSFSRTVLFIITLSKTTVNAYIHYTSSETCHVADKWSVWQSFAPEAFQQSLQHLFCWPRVLLSEMQFHHSSWCRGFALKSYRLRPFFVQEMTRPCHLWEGISHAVFIGEWVSPHLTAALSGFELQRCFFFCWTLSCKENTKLPTIDLVVSFCSRRVKVYRFTSSEMCCLTNYSEESFTEGSWIMRVFMWSKLETQ